MTAAIDAYEFAGNEIGLDEEQHRLGDLFGAAPSRQRRRLEHLRIFFGGQVGWRQNWTGRDRVDENFRRELQRQSFSQRSHRGFRYIVRYVVLVVRAAG